MKPQAVAPGGSPLLGRWGWSVFAVVHLVATGLLFLPTFFVVVGVQAAGAAAGWWSGDPNANDGEEFFAAPVGLLGWAVVMALTAGLVARLISPRKSGRFIVGGWLLLVLGQLLAWSVWQGVLSGF